MSVARSEGWRASARFSNAAGSAAYAARPFSTTLGVRGRAGQRRGLEDDHVLQRLLHLGRRLLRGEDLRRLLGRRRERDGRAGVLEEVRRLLGDHRREDRHEHGAVALAGEVHDRPLGPVLREKRHAAALLHAETFERRRKRP